MTYCTMTSFPGRGGADGRSSRLSLSGVARFLGPGQRCNANDRTRQPASRVDHDHLDLPGRRRSPAYPADRANFYAAAAGMSTVHETIYPVLPAEPGAAELKVAFTPSAAEIRFVRRQSRQEASAVLIMVQLKLLQRLGYFPMLVDVPPVIIDHIRSAMRARALSRAAIARYDISGTRIRHQKLLRRWLDIRAFDASETAWLTELASAEVRTKIELPDLINVLIEELVRRRYELPPLATPQ